MKARLDRVYERLDEQDCYIKDMNEVLVQIKGMDWAKLRHKIDMDIQAMQDTVDVTKRMTIEFAAKIAGLREDHNQVFSVIKREVGMVKISFTDYQQTVKEE